MAGAFEIATKSAIREIILNSVHESRFGYVLSQDNLDALNDQIFDLILTSRNLKAAGDRMLSQGIPSSNGASRGPTLKR
ncbi:MAG: hypothetical protein EOP07_23945 [Proteobacteria bacterium]|nr:MAG: hypothetical protein EOP07_23945 [Pseudomonadota bacterium]